MSKRDSLSRRQANLSPAKQALLEKWTRGEGKTKLSVIQQRKEQGPPPLSFAQQRLWFLNQLDPNSTSYNIPITIRVTGRLNLAALSQSLNEIVLRHEVLRTTFTVIESQPVQVIHSAPTSTISVVDLRSLSDLKREPEVKQLAIEANQCPFDLGVGPLLRTTLLWLDEEEYILHVVMHHIVTDGWSMGIFMEELSTLYPAFCAGVSSPLPELSIQYADFAVWQRQWLSGEVLQNQLNYWRDQLARAPELLQLPIDRPRPVVQTYRGRTHSWTLDTDLTQKLQSLSRESGTTLFMTLLAAFATLLCRYSGQSDILIGSPIANRNRSEVESLIGFFVNTLVLRTRFEDNPSFENLLLQVRETTLKAYEHQDVPFEQVVEALQQQRSLSHSPLFQVMFVLQNAPMGEVELPGVTLTQLDHESTIAQFDLTLSMSETDQGLVGEWEYNTDLFDGSTIERMADHFQNLLSAIVENPQLAVGELPLLSEAERHQLLREWNDTLSVYPTDKCIHQLFEEQVQKTPHSVAVVFENQQLTYLQLNQRANQLAHYLLSLGVEPEVLVGICVERSVEMVVGLLGILKAGGAYVPLDPAYPQERLAHMLSDSQVSVLLTSGKLQSQLPLHSTKIVRLDTDSQVISHQPDTNPVIAVEPLNLAYVIYTSGSTGKSKGVLIPHQALVNHNYAIAKDYELTASDRILQFASFSFDVAAEEIFPTWLSGATLVLQPEQRLSISDFVQFVNKQNLTVLNLPVVYWLEWVAQMPHISWANSVRLLVVGSDKVPLEQLMAWQKLVGSNISWRNAYGPTEATITATVYGAQLSLEQEKASLLFIGRPITHTQIYILDRHLQPVPIGIPGELYIGGALLARGYLNRPELTSEKFIANPFSNSKSERLYKTGDLARYSRDGNVEYLGRIDNQVKIRGFRIELGEIEALLSQHPAVLQTVVIAQEDVPGDKRLVAYLVSEQENAPTINDLRQFLKEKLPEYMIPSVFVFLEALPLTPNGKVDRRALSTLNVSTKSLVASFVQPRSPSEKTLAEIWANVLRLEQVGIYENFFELGGHSLLAIQVMLRVQEAFSVDLSVRQLFEFPTVAQLSEVIEKLIEKDAVFQSPTIMSVSRETRRMKRSSLIKNEIASSAQNIKGHAPQRSEVKSHTGLDITSTILKSSVQ